MRSDAGGEIWRDLWVLGTNDTRQEGEVRPAHSLFNFLVSLRESSESTLHQE